MNIYKDIKVSDLQAIFHYPLDYSYFFFVYREIKSYTIRCLNICTRHGCMQQVSAMLKQVKSKALGFKV